MQHSMRLKFFGARLLVNIGACHIALSVTSYRAITLSVFLLHVLYLLPTVTSPVLTIKSHLLHVMHAYHLSIIFVETHILYIIA